MISLADVRKVYNEGRPDEVTAVDGLSLSIEPNTVTVLHGPSGSGKTSLLTLVGGMARPTSGRITVDGEEITSLPERFLTALRRQKFGFVFQGGNLVRGLTALENVMLPAYPLGESRPALVLRARALLQRFGLAHRERSKVEWLSGGEAQRAAIARALINEPKVVIADEPTAHLDTRLTLEFMDIVRELKEQKKTLVIASHDPRVREAACVDRAVGLRDGKLAPDAASEVGR